MRIKTISKSLKGLIILLSITFSCGKQSEVPIMPESISMYSRPNERAIEYSESATIDWDTLAYPDFNIRSTKKFDFDNIEAKPFDLTDPNPFEKFIDSVSFDYSQLPSEKLNMLDWPEIELNISTNRLGQPEIIDAGALSSQPGFSRGVLEIDQAFGITVQLNGLYEDKQGFLWFGGVNNLYKYHYDKLYKYGNAQGLNFTRLNRLIEDENDRLWLGTGNSLIIIDFKLNLSYKITNLPAGQVNVIKPLSNGQVLVGLFESAYYFIDLEQNVMRKFGPEQGLLNADFLVAEPLEEDQRLWLGSAGGINVLDFKNNTNIKITDKTGLPNNNISLIFQDLVGRVWISTFGGTIILSKDFDKKYNFFRNDISLSSALQENDSIIWFGTTNGVIGRINDVKNEATAYRLKTGANHIVYNLLISKQGQLWASKVVNSGVFVLDLNSSKPGNYTEDDGLSNNRVWSTLPINNDEVWLGSYDGIDIYNSNTKSIKHLGQSQGLAEERNTELTEIEDDIIWSTNRSQNISIINTQNQTIGVFQARFMENGDGIATVFKSKSGIIWIGSNNGFIYKINPIQQSLYSLKLPMAEAGLNIDNILENDEGEIFFNADFHGVYKISKDFNSLSKLYPGDSELIEQVYSMDFDENFNLWLGAFNGVHKVNITQRTIKTYSTDQGLPANDTYVIKCDDGKTYAGTSQGLSVIKEIDESNDEFNIKTIDRNDGLRYLDFAQNSLSIDKQGRIWAGVEDEILTVMDPIEMDTTNIETIITGLDIYDRALHFKAPYDSEEKWIGNDTIWSTDNSTYTLKKEFESKNDNYSFSEINPVYNLPMDLQLASDQNYLSFRYHRPQFRNPENLKYSYILEGIDKVWSAPTTDTHTENYRDLPAGDYTFKVTALGPNDKWSTPSKFSFSIIPPWWQTVWARLLFFILFLGILWSIISYRSQWLKKENRLLEEKVSHRTKQLKLKIEELKSTQKQLIQSEKMASLGELTAGIAHEIQNPLNFVNNFSEINQELITEMHDELKAGNMEETLLIANDIRDNEQKIYHHGKRADSIVKGMLQHSRNHSGEKEPTDINALCDEYLRLAYHGLRAKDKSFNATLASDFDENLQKLIVVPQDIGRVVLNIINNGLYAIKDKKLKLNDETYKPTVTVITEKTDKTALIKIIDNGNGIPTKVRDKIFQPFFTTKSAGEGTGLGLSMSYDIIKAHGGELIVDSEEGKGTTFIIELPIS